MTDIAKARRERNLIAASRCIAALDLNASLDLADEIPGTGLTMEKLATDVASWVCTVLGAHHGTGSSAASHALRKIDREQVSFILIAWGASPFLIEQWAGEITERVWSQSYRGGSR